MPVLLALASFLVAQEKVDLSKTKLFVYDQEKGITLRVKDDGKVELAVKEDKTYSAESVDEFEKKYPQIVKKQGLGRYLHPKGRAGEGLDRFWLPELPEFDQDLGKLLEQQKRQLEDLRKDLERRFGDLERPLPRVPGSPAPAPTPLGKEFGVKIESLGETLRDQLGLKEGEGILVAEVKPGSIAEKSGLKQHDIILRLDGKAAGDTWQFRKDALQALEKPQFDVEIVRAGARQTLKAVTGAKKEE